MGAVDVLDEPVAEGLDLVDFQIVEVALATGEQRDDLVLDREPERSVPA